jgi:hypothetical protein
MVSRPIDQVHLLPTPSALLHCIDLHALYLEGTCVRFTRADPRFHAGLLVARADGAFPSSWRRCLVQVDSRC